MPKERRDRSVSFDRSQVSPYPCSSSRTKQSKNKNAPESDVEVKEWEEARCPVCMEHPHNAVLLICTSHEKGCRPYMCDTSYRHSNCLDQFRKSFSETSKDENSEPIVSEQPSTGDVDLVETRPNDTQIEGSEEMSSVQTMLCDNQEEPKLVCPLCRGEVTGWIIVDSARNYMNAKSRSCASETCDFCGTYADLRKHARQDHPLVRPMEADPERERNWRRLERQRDLGDLISTLSSLEEDRNENNNSILSFDDGGWLTVFFLIRVFRSGNSSRSSSWSGTSRARAHITVRRRSARLWGEAHDGETESVARDSGDNESSDGGSDTRRTHRHNESSDGASVGPRTRWRLRRQSSQDNERL